MRGEKINKKQKSLINEIKSLDERLSALEKRVVNNGGGWV